MSLAMKNVAGVDVAKEKFDTALWAWNLGLHFESLPFKEFPRTLQGAKRFVAWCSKKLKGINGYADFRNEPLHVVMDSTGRYSMELAAWLLKADPEIQVSIVNSYHLHHFRKSLGETNKTDRIDAATHARYGVERDPETFRPKEDIYIQLQSFVRQRKAFQKELIAARARLAEPLTPKEVRTLQKAHVRFLKRQIDKIEQSIDDLFEFDPKLKRDKELLETIPGIGKITVYSVMGELGDLRQYKTSRELSSMSGLAPKVFESGNKKGRTTISRKGSRLLRSSLYLPALVATRVVKRETNMFQRKYENMRAKGKCHKTAICAIMRKQLIVMRSLLINETIYRDDYQKTKISSKKEPVDNRAQEVENL